MGDAPPGGGTKSSGGVSSTVDDLGVKAGTASSSLCAPFFSSKDLSFFSNANDPIQLAIVDAENITSFERNLFSTLA